MKMIYINFGSLFSLFVLQVYCYKKTSEEDSIFSMHTSHNLPIEHSFGVDDEFAPRGSIVFKGSKGGHAAFSTDIELSNEEIYKLQMLVKENGLYFIRSPIKIGNDFAADVAENNGTRYVQTFVKSCYLYGSKLQETITVSIDYSGNVIGLNIVSPKSVCSQDTDFINGPTIFNSTIVVQQQVAGAVPDTQTFLKKMEQEAMNEKQGKGKDNRSFLAKYWMYILPVFLILMLSAQAEQPAEGGGGE